MTIRRCKDSNDGTIQNTRTRMVGLLERNGWWDHWRDKDQDGGTIGETRAMGSVMARLQNTRTTV